MDFAVGRVVVVRRLPVDVPAALERPRIRALVVDRDFVFDSVHVDARVALDEMQEPRVRHPVPEGPEFLVEPDGVDDERVAFPVADRIAEVAGVQIVVRRMLPARLHRDPFPVAVLAIDHEDAVVLGILKELRSVRRGQEPEPAGRLTPRVRIVQAIPEVAVLVQSLGPGAERHFGDVEIRRQRIARLADELAVEGVPEPLLSGNGAEIDLSVRQAGRRPGRGRRLRWRRARPRPAGAWAFESTGSDTTIASAIPVATMLPGPNH